MCVQFQCEALSERYLYIFATESIPPTSSLRLFKAEGIAVNYTLEFGEKAKEKMASGASFSHCRPQTSRLCVAVSFCSKVTVRIIPSRREYTDEEQQLLWTRKHELTEMVSRNLLEFASEGWDSKNVLEEDGMIDRDGHLIHPVHANPILASALRRRIPYPRAVAPFLEESDVSGEIDADETTDIESEAIHCIDFPIERPDSPFLESFVDEFFPGYESNFRLSEEVLVHLRL